MARLEASFLPKRCARPTKHVWSVDKLMDVLALKFATQSNSVRRAFRAVASAGSDRIGPEQFKRWLHTLNLGVGSKLARKLFDRLDADCSGSISYEEFRMAFGETISGSAYQGQAFEPGFREHEQRLLAIEKARLRTEPSFSSVDDCVALLRERMATQHTKVRKAFRLLDHDHSGVLDRAELRRMLEIYNIRLDDASLDALMSRISPQSGTEQGVSYRAFTAFFGADIAGSSFRNSEQVEQRCSRDAQWAGANAAFAEYMSRRQAALRALPKKEWSTPEFLATLEAVLASRSKTVRRIFRMCDTDSSGLIDVDEFHRALHKLNIATSIEESTKFFHMFDDDGSGTISYAELMQKIGPIVAGFKDTGVLTMKGIDRTDEAERRGLADAIAARQRIVRQAALPRYTVAQIKDVIAKRLGNKYSSACTAFRQIDRNHAGKLSRADLRLFLKFRNIELHPDDFDALMAELDSDQSGVVEYEEFIRSFGEAICGTPWESLQTSLAESSIARREATTPVVKHMPPEEALAKLHIKLGETSASVNRLFKRYNKDRAGKLDASRIELVFRNYNLDISSEQDLKTIVALIKSRHKDVPTDDLGDTELSYRLFCAEFGPSISGERYVGIRDPFEHFARKPPASLPPPAPAVDADTAKTMLLEKLAINYAHARKAFVNFNTERDGVLDPDELRRALENYNIHMTDTEFAKFLRNFDAEGLGSIHFDQFVKNVGVSVSGDQDTGLSIVMQDHDERVKARRKQFEVSFQEILAEDEDDEDDEAHQDEEVSLSQELSADLTKTTLPTSASEPNLSLMPDEGTQCDSAPVSTRRVHHATAKRPKFKVRLAAARRRQAALERARQLVFQPRVHWQMCDDFLDASSSAITAVPQLSSNRHTASAPKIITHAP